MLCALARSLALFAIISTRLINTIFRIGRYQRSGALGGGSIFNIYVDADIDRGGEVEKVCLPAA